MKKNEMLKIISFIILSLFLNSIIIFVLLKIFGFRTDLQLLLELLLYLEIILLIPLIAIFKPLIGLYAVFFIELTLKNFHLGPASIRTVILLLLVALFAWNELFVKKKKLASLYDYIRDPIIQFSLLFLLWHLITFTVIHRDKFDPNLVLRMFIGISIPVLCLSFLKSKKSVRTFIYVGISALFLSSLVALLQKHIGGLFFRLPRFLGETDPYLFKVALQEKRYFGLTESNLRLAYDIVNIFPLLISILLVGLTGKKIINRKKIALLLMSVVIFYSLILTGTRSAFFGIIFSLLLTVILIGLLQKKIFLRIAKELSVYVVILIVLASAINISKIQSFTRIKNIYEEYSAGAKIPKFVSGLKASKESLLFGTGSTLVEPLESEEEVPAFLRKYSEGTGGARVHNMFINNLLLGGVPRLVLLVIFLSLVVINAFYMLKKTIIDEEKKGYFLYYFGFSIWIVAYIIDKMVHNADPFSDVLFWYVLGSMIALTAIYKKESSPKKSHDFI